MPKMTNDQVRFICDAIDRQTLTLAAATIMSTRNIFDDDTFDKAVLLSRDLLRDAYTTMDARSPVDSAGFRYK